MARQYRDCCAWRHTGQRIDTPSSEDRTSARLTSTFGTQLDGRGYAGWGQYPPLRVLSEDPINTEFLHVVAFPGKVFLTNNELSAIKPGPVRTYLYSRGGYPTLVNTQLVVQNSRSYPIHIIDMHVIKSCHAPLTGTLFYQPAQGAIQSIQMFFNLDSTDTGAKVTKGAQSSDSLPDYFSRYTVSISPGDDQVFDILAETARYSCTFRYEATILDGGKVYQTIGDGSQPFKISAVVTGAGKVPFARYSVRTQAVSRYSRPGWIR